MSHVIPEVVWTIADYSNDSSNPGKWMYLRLRRLEKYDQSLRSRVSIGAVLSCVVLEVLIVRKKYVDFLLYPTTTRDNSDGVPFLKPERCVDEECLESQRHGCTDPRCGRKTVGQVKHWGAKDLEEVHVYKYLGPSPPYAVCRMADDTTV